MNDILSRLPVTCHTHYIAPGGTFVAIKGLKDDGARFIPEAIARGAQKIVVSHDAVLSHDVQALCDKQRVNVIRVTNTRRALAELSAQAHGFPAQKLTIIGITGTKGKTTCAFILAHIFKTAGYRTALIGTVHNTIGDEIFPAPLTTPQPDYLHAFLHLCVERNVRIVIMEVAAQALSLDRVTGISFDAVLFTNFSREHGEFYASIDDYFAAKATIFQQRKPGAPAFVNGDDERLKPFTYTLSNVYGMSMHDSQAHTSFKITGDDMSGISWNITRNNHTASYHAPALVGTYNVANSTLAEMCATYMKIPEADIARGFETFLGTPGRLDRYLLPNGALAIVDYAHNPASFEAVLSTLKKHTPHLIAVFGAGGERDAGRRPLMGACAAQFADEIILTADNPRSEDPAIIAQDILAGIASAHHAKVHVELDREAAIRAAYMRTSSHSIMVVLGKGPDEYQLVQGAKHYFSDKKIVQTLGQER